MRTKCRSIATFHRPIHSHWSLPWVSCAKCNISLDMVYSAFVAILVRNKVLLGVFFRVSDVGWENPPSFSLQSKQFNWNMPFFLFFYVFQRETDFCCNICNCIISSLGSNSHSKKNTKWATRHKQRSGQHTLARQKNIQNICLTQISLKKSSSLIPRDTTFKNLFFLSSLFNLLTALNVSKCVRRKGQLHQINGLMWRRQTAWHFSRHSFVRARVTRGEMRADTL